MFGICVEASHRRGMGHLFRVINLCTELRRKGIPFQIFINPHGSSQTLLKERHLPFEEVELESMHDSWQARVIQQHAIDLWIDDRLDTELSHALQINRCGIPRITFDDRGPGAELADLNVAGLSFDKSEPLSGRKVLRGPNYLILNHEIENYRRSRTDMKSIVVTLGGSDTYGVTVRVVEILKAAGLGATIIIGPSFQHEDELHNVLNSTFTLKRNIPSLIEELSHHDLAITGGGITPFEANASGLPCMVIANEFFEIPVGLGIASMGGAIFVGHYSELGDRLPFDELAIDKMSQAAMRHIDLLGASRVIDEIGMLA